MKTVIQRVSKASVTIDGAPHSSISTGLLILVGFAATDTDEDMRWMAQKVVNMRIFSDQDGKMNRSVQDVGGEILLVSQFTLYGDATKGNRPSFIHAAPPPLAQSLYDRFVTILSSQSTVVKTGRFGADMKVESINDGPVTILLDR